MDRNYYYEKMAKQREFEISRELATANLLKEARLKVPSIKRKAQSVLRIAVVSIAVIILILVGFPG